MEVSIKVDYEDAIGVLMATPAKVQRALATAINQTAITAQTNEVAEMQRVFDRPTPWTLGSVGRLNATTSRETATVYLKDEAGKGNAAAQYLAPQIEGGTRDWKRFELGLMRVGAMPQGMFAVPGVGATLDAYGNMARGQITQILAFFQAFPENGYRANMTSVGRAKLAKGTKRTQGFAYFVGRPGGGRMPLGVYQRTSFAAGSAIKPVLLFVSSVHYGKRYDFEGVVEKTVADEFESNFEAALDATG